MTQPAEIKQGGGRGLERQMVVKAALQLLDDAGFGGLTLRRLAERLQVKAAALYWHFENKQDLIDAMAAEILRSEFAHMPAASRDWRDLLSAVAHTHRAALQKHRDGAQVMAHAQLRQAELLEGLEQLVQALREQGFSSELIVASFFSIIRYTLGYVFEDQADPRNRPGRASATERQKWLTAMGAYPTVRQVFGDVAARHGEQYTDHLFAAGLSLLLDGVGQQLAKAA